MKLRDYFHMHVHRPYKARDWDCFRFVIGWIATFAPRCAEQAVKRVVAAGYNKVAAGDDAGLRRVHEAMGIATPEDFVQYFFREMPQHADLPLAAAPGDIVVRQGLACGILDEDFQAVFLASRRGYEKQAMQPGDAFLRARD